MSKLIFFIRDQGDLLTIDLLQFLESDIEKQITREIEEVLNGKFYWRSDIWIPLHSLRFIYRDRIGYMDLLTDRNETMISFGIRI